MCSGAIDSDGDGLTDAEDTDDDNDGLLDTGHLFYKRHISTFIIFINIEDDDDDGDGIADDDEDDDGDGLTNEG